MARMFGCERAATARASRSKRASASGRAREIGRQNLDRDIAIQLRVARAIDLAHAARARAARRFRTDQDGAGR